MPKYWLCILFASPIDHVIMLEEKDESNVENHITEKPDKIRKAKMKVDSALRKIFKAFKEEKEKETDSTNLN